MLSKPDYYKLVQEIRAMLDKPENLTCTCPKTSCEWHGKCRECVAIHRYYRDHLPNCMQQFVNEKIAALAQLGEMQVVEKPKTPPEYWDYVREQDRKSEE